MVSFFMPASFRFVRMDFFQQLAANLKASTLLEYIAVITGIVSVWFSKKENILVFPVGLINTITYTWLSFSLALYGEAGVNLYYTIVSIYGWILWAGKDEKNKSSLKITRSSSRQWLGQLVFFTAFYFTIYFLLVYVKQAFYASTIPALDAFASAAAFTGMWLIAKKKLESWYWWIVTNIAAIPLYYMKGLALSSIYYFILLMLAIAGLMEWKKKAVHAR